MNDVNWWLMAPAFLLGLLLTFAFMIRRVKREVPIYAEGRAARAGAGAKLKRPDVDVEGRGGKTTGTVAAGAAAGAAGAAAAKFTGGKAGKEPYGSGSLRLAAGASAPSGYTIKGNEDSMLYHTPDSPSYKQTIAELWFRDEATAERAGFTRWDKGEAVGGARQLAGVPPGPYGVGSAKPGPGGTGPQGWTVKGNEDSMLYHTPDSPSYEETIAEMWFVDEETAVKAGFEPWHKGKK